MIRARVTVRLTNRAISRSLVLAVKPDNLKMEGLSVVGKTNRTGAQFRLAFDGKVETFIFTLDDLLRCIQAAKEALDSISGKRPE